MQPTRHIKQRMSQRGISQDMVNLVLTHGAIDGDKCVVGRKEAAEGLVSLRRLGSNDQTVMPVADALAMLAKEATAPDVARRGA